MLHTFTTAAFVRTLERPPFFLADTIKSAALDITVIQYNFKVTYRILLCAKPASGHSLSVYTSVRCNS